MNLGFLTPLLHQPGPWASVYFNTSEIAEDAVPQLALQARAAADQLAAQGADQETCRAVHTALTDLDRYEAGHALFATDGRVVLDIPLTAPPPSPPLTEWGPLPRLGPILDFGERRPPTLVAFVDRKGADLQYRGTHGRPRPLDEVRGREWPIHRTGRIDWSERHFELAVENTWEENARLIAQTLAEDAARTGAELLVLAGDARERRAVFDQLPEPLRAITVESEYGGRAAGARPERLETEVAEARTARDTRRAAELYDRFLAGRVPTEERRVDAVEGVPALLAAAREHRIDTLLVRLDGPDLHRDVWIGEEPDQLAVRRSESQYLGEPDPLAARADDALLRSVAATDADVIVVAGSSPEDGPVVATEGLPAGGLGALLRWPYRDGVPDGGHRAPG
ncbi:Vms1/Ankzf1 family peptidyl-tRNA hydrolase [Streptomyces sp. DSM 44915]|uniref:Vms1/Ankzf1 family peptidyl-tRNA hydrolase n=1 Tax=Streptomyces chisholmiae TaxID=3075540 RepID=A0ABU2JUL2_9ACTN|nr:Vms1/Ankzf1 family peptidyl-tRNA hydrolase [Streptomyces sp. DSM 44915]MDT0268434.1 Vms1/Ankzf1 family peptidyl-tRNA hydrolase [Streptomyces sp. DSM 44915]